MSAASRASRRPFAGKRVLLGVTGGIAAYKTVQLARDLALAGAAVEVVLSHGATEFVRPLAFEALTGRPVHTGIFAPGEAATHIRLARDADVIAVAPATANFVAQSAAGMASDLLTSVLLATSAPVLICPAMNDRMFAHPQTQANLKRLGELGYTVVGPAVGPLAWGEGEGPGRMVEPPEIVEHIGRALEAQSLRGRRVLVTAGPTREPIDPVRYVGNRSSGRMGYALAASAWRRGADVALISGPSTLSTPPSVAVTRVETAEEMCDAVRAALPRADLLVMAAAVADFRPATPSARKIKKGREPVPEVLLEPTADVLAATRELRPPGCVVVGFALETDDVLGNARRKLREKDVDLLVLNDAREPGAGFEVETNRVTLLHRDGAEESLPLASKPQIADQILDRIERLLAD